MTYKVGRTFETAKIYMALGQACRAALKVGDPVCIWKGSTGHWALVLDRSVPADRLPLGEHIANIFGP
jgi:hypothetical protein